MTIAGSLVIPGAAASGGGGLVAKNYYSTNPTTGVTPTTTPSAFAMALNDQEGTPGVILDVDDNTTIDVSLTGIYVVNVQVSEFAWAAQGAVADINYFQLALDFTCADSNALASLNNPWTSISAYDQKTSLSGIQPSLTTPPLALAAGDSFQWKIAILLAATASTNPAMGDNSSLNVVRLG